MPYSDIITGCPGKAIFPTRKERKYILSSTELPPQLNRALNFADQKPIVIHYYLKPHPRLSFQCSGSWFKSRECLRNQFMSGCNAGDLQDEYMKCSAEFPGVYYLSRSANKFGRIQSVESSNDRIFYSDKKSIMTSAGSDKIYTVLEESGYLINLAAMKGHNSAGISLCVKNHFGTQTRASAMHLHPGLNNSNRMGYGHYRVLVDLMGNGYPVERTYSIFLIVFGREITGTHSPLNF